MMWHTVENISFPRLLGGDTFHLHFYVEKVRANTRTFMCRENIPGLPFDERPIKHYRCMHPDLVFITTVTERNDIVDYDYFGVRYCTERLWAMGDLPHAFLDGTFCLGNAQSLLFDKLLKKPRPRPELASLFFNTVFEIPLASNHWTMMPLNSPSMLGKLWAMVPQLREVVMRDE